MCWGLSWKYVFPCLYELSIPSMCKQDMNELSGVCKALLQIE